MARAAQRTPWMLALTILGAFGAGLFRPAVGNLFDSMWEPYAYALVGAIFGALGGLILELRGGPPAKSE